MLVIKPNQRFGEHTRLQKTVTQTILSFQGYTGQFYVGNPRSFPVRDFSLERSLIEDVCFKRDITAYIHASNAVYVGNPKGDHHGNKCDAHLKAILEQTAGLPIGTVVHIAKGSKTHLEDVFHRLSGIRRPKCSGRLKASLLLENAAGQKNEKGMTPDELRKIFEAVDNTSDLGICLDTQHLFSAGVCDFQSGSFEKVYEEFRSVGHIQLLHLNDSKVQFAAGVDRHERLGRGYIWGKDQTTLWDLLTLAQDNSLDAVIEKTYPGDLQMILEKMCVKI